MWRSWLNSKLLVLEMIAMTDRLRRPCQYGGWVVRWVQTITVTVCLRLRCFLLSLNLFLDSPKSTLSISLRCQNDHLLSYTKIITQLLCSGWCWPQDTPTVAQGKLLDHTQHFWWFLLHFPYNWSGWCTSDNLYAKYRNISKSVFMFNVTKVVVDKESVLSIHMSIPIVDR